MKIYFGLFHQLIPTKCTSQANHRTHSWLIFTHTTVFITQLCLRPWIHIWSVYYLQINRQNKNKMQETKVYEMIQLGKIMDS